jgi:hypothetical protein
LTEGETTGHPVIVWVAEGTWRACVDAALALAPAGARITLLHVTPAEVPEAAHGAYLGLFGRGVAAVIPARASRSWPPPQPASCTAPPPAGSAARATGSNAMVTPNGRW